MVTSKQMSACTCSPCTVSAAMVGVCLTVIGIIRVSLTLNAGYSTLADDLLVVSLSADGSGGKPSWDGEAIICRRQPNLCRTVVSLHGTARSRL